jgi:hypothetical protein
MYRLCVYSWTGSTEAKSYTKDRTPGVIFTLRESGKIRHSLQSLVYPCHTLLRAKTNTNLVSLSVQLFINMTSDVFFCGALC